jgi:type I restriction enzyme S subunit
LWSLCCLDDIGTTNIGLTYKPTAVCESGVPVIRSNNIRDGHLEFADLVRVSTSLNENLLLNKGDIIICARNGSRHLVGKCALMYDLYEPMTFGAFMAVFRSVCNRYVYYFLHTDDFRKIFQSEGISTQINQLTQTMIKQTIIPLPPLAEQHRIVTAIETMFAQLDSITAELASNI